MLSATSARFFTLVQIAITILLASGFLMLALGLLMIELYSHILWALYPRLQRAMAEQDWPLVGAVLNSIRQRVRLNLGLGGLVFVIAVLGRDG
ncbi:hypothetical protein [Roseateles albus]|uniref:Uncharacterized protein n=1 Tax=Roseateles albus TaxID=2987525 RepID=A0ABT5KG23_9BURK|nr:hypothetical protein [Roseateles albus]MDC8772409.1 hypothetical protein [Roseateles albus]